jgi:AcrR family transcriptional regulator
MTIKSRYTPGGAVGSSTAARRPPQVPAERPGPAGGARDRNRRRRVEQLCRAGLELFLRRGVGEVTIDDIARRARLAKGSFYRYFRDKEELVETLVAPVAELFRAAAVVCEHRSRAARTPADFALAYFEMARTVAGAVTAHQAVVRLYLQEARGPAIGARRPLRRLHDEIADRAVALGAIARATGLYRDLDSRLVTLAIIGAGERLLYEHLVRAPFADPTQVALALVSIVEDGLKPR